MGDFCPPDSLFIPQPNSWLCPCLIPLPSTSSKFHDSRSLRFQCPKFLIPGFFPAMPHWPHHCFQLRRWPPVVEFWGRVIDTEVPGSEMVCRRQVCHSLRCRSFVASLTWFLLCRASVASKCEFARATESVYTTGGGGLMTKRLKKFGRHNGVFSRKFIFTKIHI